MPHIPYNFETMSLVSLRAALAAPTGDFFSDAIVAAAMKRFDVKLNPRKKA